MADPSVLDGAAPFDGVMGRILRRVRELEENAPDANRGVLDFLCQALGEHIEAREGEVVRLTSAITVLQEELRDLRAQRARERHTEDMGK